MKHRRFGKQVALFTGALRRQAFRRSRPSRTATPTRPAALDAVRVELWNDDHRLLRALLVLVATFSVGFWYYAIERIIATSALIEASEEVALEAVETTTLTKPITFSVTGDRGATHVKLEPIPGKRPIATTEAVQAALDYLRLSGLNVKTATNIALKSATTGLDIAADVWIYNPMPLLEAKMSSADEWTRWGRPGYGGLAVETSDVDRFSAKAQALRAKELRRIAELQANLKNWTPEERLEAVTTKCPLHALPVKATIVSDFDSLGREKPVSTQLRRGGQHMWRWSGFARSGTETTHQSPGIFVPINTHGLTVLSTRVASPMKPDQSFFADDTSSLNCDREYPTEYAVSWKMAPKDDDAYVVAWKARATAADMKPLLEEAQKTVLTGGLSVGGETRLRAVGVVVLIPLVALGLSLSLSVQIRKLASLSPSLLQRALLIEDKAYPSARLSPIDGFLMRGTERLAKSLLLVVILLSLPTVSAFAAFVSFAPIHLNGYLFDWDYVRYLSGYRLYIDISVTTALFALACHQLWAVFDSARKAGSHTQQI